LKLPQGVKGINAFQQCDRTGNFRCPRRCCAPEEKVDQGSVFLESMQDGINELKRTIDMISKPKSRGFLQVILKQDKKTNKQRQQSVSNDVYGKDSMGNPAGSA